MPDEMTSPSGPWDAGRTPFSLNYLDKGCTNLSGWRLAIDTENQELSGELRVTGYKLQTPNTKYDFYSVFGQMTHGVSHGGGAYDPSTNWVSVGYYANAMSLVLGVVNDAPGAEIWDAGPTSTVGTDTSSFNIGGNLSGGTMAGEPVLTAGVSGGFGASFSSPDVTIATSQVGDHVRWDVKLPSVGYVSPGNPANPREPSYAGYKWYFGVIYAVPKAKGLILSVNPEIDWEFDYTRGIAYNTKKWSQTTQFNLDA
jgi:hypothetical protein